MAIREIIKLPHPTLRRKAHKVVDFDADLRTLIEDMIDTMRDEPGVGLAAPQVNIPLQVIVVEYAEDDSNPDSESVLYAYVNPEITHLSKEKVEGIEGCLSVPNIYGDVERSLSLTVKGYNQFGKKISVHADGWLARIFQHEIDHINGILFVDRAETLYEPDEIPPSTNV